MSLALTGTFDDSKIMAGLDRVARKLDALTDATDKAGARSKKASGDIDLVTKALKGLVTIQAGKFIVQTVVALDQLGGSAIRAEASLNAITDSQAPQFIDAVATASGGAVSELDAMSISARALQLGVVDTAGQMEQLTEVGVALGRVMGLDATTAVNDLATGIGRLSPPILDNLGLNIKLSEAYQAFSEATGISVDEMTKAQQQTAVLNSVLAQGLPIVDKMATGQVDSATAGEQMAAAFDDARAAVGRFVATSQQSIAVKALFTDIAGSIETLAEKAIESREALATQAEVVVENTDSFKDAIAQLEGYTTWQAAGAAAVASTKKQQEDLNTEIERADSGFLGAAAATANMTGEMQTLAQAELAAAEAANELAARQQAVFDANEAVAQTVQGLIDVSAAQTDQWTTQIDSAGILTANLEAMNMPAQEMLRINTELALATGQITEATLEQAEAQQILAGLLADEAISAEDAIALSQEVANGRQEAIDQVGELAVIQEELAAGLDMVGDDSLKAQEGIEDLGETDAEIDPVTKSLDNMTGVLQANIDKAIELRDTLKGMARVTVSGEIRVTVTGEGAAQGVENFEGGMLLVGEEGPELVVLPRGSSVIPNPETEALLSAPMQVRNILASPALAPGDMSGAGGTSNAAEGGGGGGGNTTVIVTLDGREITRIVTDKMQQAGLIEETVNLV